MSGKNFKMVRQQQVPVRQSLQFFMAASLYRGKPEMRPKEGKNQAMVVLHPNEGMPSTC
jgi:hypothetical protein